MKTISDAEFRKRLGLPPDSSPKISTAGFSEEEIEAMCLPPEKTYFEIDGAARIYLPANGDGNREEFARQFQNAWNRVPHEDRQTLTNFWQAKKPPTIELESSLKEVGRYDAESILLGFNAQGVTAAIEDEMLEDMIGHETGHAYCHTQPGSAMADPNGRLVPREDEANLKAMEWGFDMAKLAKWGNSKSNFFEKITKNGAYSQSFTPVPYHEKMNPNGPKAQ